MWVKKQQLELDMEQWTGSKLGKEYVNAAYCHPVSHFSPSIFHDVLFLENSCGQRILACYSPWGYKELDMTERLSIAQHSAYKFNKQGDSIQPCHTPFPIWNQSIVPCPVLIVASRPAYRFLRRQVRWSGIPIS